MVMQRRPTVRRNANGTARIKRDSYSNAQTDWWAIRKEVFERDGGKCQSRDSGRICLRPGVDVHHILSLARGGTTTKSNLVTLCEEHHQARHRHDIGKDRPKPKNPWGRKPALKPYKP